MKDNKTFVGITGVNTDIGCHDNEINISYIIMTPEEATLVAQNRSYYGTGHVLPKFNKIKLENPDPKLLYTIFELIGRLGYSVIEYKNEVEKNENN